LTSTIGIAFPRECCLLPSAKSPLMLASCECGSELELLQSPRRRRTSSTGSLASTTLSATSTFRRKLGDGPLASKGACDTGLDARRRTSSTGCLTGVGTRSSALVHRQKVFEGGHAAKAAADGTGGESLPGIRSSGPLKTPRGSGTSSRWCQQAHQPRLGRLTSSATPPRSRSAEPERSSTLASVAHCQTKVAPHASGKTSRGSLPFEVSTAIDECWNTGLTHSEEAASCAVQQKRQAVDHSALGATLPTVASDLFAVQQVARTIDECWGSAPLLSEVADAHSAKPVMLTSADECCSAALPLSGMTDSIVSQDVVPGAAEFSSALSPENDWPKACVPQVVSLDDCWNVVWANSDPPKAVESEEAESETPRACSARHKALWLTDETCRGSNDKLQSCGWMRTSLVDTPPAPITQRTSTRATQLVPDGLSRLADLNVNIQELRSMRGALRPRPKPTLPVTGDEGPLSVEAELQTPRLAHFDPSSCAEELFKSPQHFEDTPVFESLQPLPDRMGEGEAELREQPTDESREEKCTDAVVIDEEEEEELQSKTEQLQKTPWGDWEKARIKGQELRTASVTQTSLPTKVQCQTQQQHTATCSQIPSLHLERLTTRRSPLTRPRSVDGHRRPAREDHSESPRPCRFPMSSRLDRSSGKTGRDTESMGRRRAHSEAKLIRDVPAPVQDGSVASRRVADVRPGVQAPRAAETNRKTPRGQKQVVEDGGGRQEWPAPLSRPPGSRRKAPESRSIPEKETLKDALKRIVYGSDADKVDEAVITRLRSVLTLDEPGPERARVRGASRNVRTRSPQAGLERQEPRPDASKHRCAGAWVVGSARATSQSSPDLKQVDRGLEVFTAHEVPEPHLAGRAGLKATASGSAHTSASGSAHTSASGSAHTSASGSAHTCARRNSSVSTTATSTRSSFTAEHLWNLTSVVGKECVHMQPSDDDSASSAQMSLAASSSSLEAWHFPGPAPITQFEVVDETVSLAMPLIFGNAD